MQTAAIRTISNWWMHWIRPMAWWHPHPRIILTVRWIIMCWIYSISMISKCPEIHCHGVKLTMPSDPKLSNKWEFTDRFRVSVLYRAHNNYEQISIATQFRYKLNLFTHYRLILIHLLSLLLHAHFKIYLRVFQPPPPPSSNAFRKEFR